MQSKVKAIPKLPGFKTMQAKREHLKKKGLSKELDQVIEKEELDYSPLKGVAPDALTFGMALR